MCRRRRRRRRKNKRTTSISLKRRDAPLNRIPCRRRGRNPAKREGGIFRGKYVSPSRKQIRRYFTTRPDFSDDTFCWRQNESRISRNPSRYCVVSVCRTRSIGVHRVRSQNAILSSPCVQLWSEFRIFVKKFRSFHFVRLAVFS